MAKIGIKIGKSNILMHRMRKLSIPPISIPRKQTTGFTLHYATKFLYRISRRLAGYDTNNHLRNDNQYTSTIVLSRFFV